MKIPRPALFESIPPGYRVRPYLPKDRDRILEIERAQREIWSKQGVDVPLSDPDSPEWVAKVCIVDPGDRVIAAIGGRKVIELGSTIDPDHGLKLIALRDLLYRSWTKLGPRLYTLGYESAFCRVTSPTPAWGNMLMKQGRFEICEAPHYYFDLEAACRPKAHEAQS